MHDFTKAIEIATNVYWVGVYVEDDPFECHTYLIVDGDESILIDPGSILEFEGVKQKIETLIDLNSIKYLVAHHQDPDVCANIPAFEKVIKRDDLLVITHSRNMALIKHYGIRSGYYIIEEHDFCLKTKNYGLYFLTTPYAHAPGAFVTYLKEEKVLFSSDIFGAMEESWHFYADENYFDEIKSFHESYMPSQDILNFSLEKIEELTLNLIAPQHGSLIQKEYINPIIEELKNLECGLYIDETYHKSLVYQNNLLREKEKNERMLKQKLEMMMDLQENIIVITNGKEIKYINKAFFEFSKFKTMDEFLQEHSCICNLFVDFEGEKYLKSKYPLDGYTWISRLQEHSEIELFAMIKDRDGKNTLFKVTLNDLSFEEKKEFLVTFQDVTPYIENTDFLNILANMNDIFFSVVGMNGKILSLSASLIKKLKIKDFTPSAYLVSDFFDTEDLIAVRRHVANNDVSSYEVTIRYNNVAIPVLIQGYYGIIRETPVRVDAIVDLSEKKRVEAESKQKDLMLLSQAKMAQMGEMVSMIAHQWRQPLNAISAASIKSVMQSELGLLEEKEFENTQEFIQNQCQKMSDVINTFMNYSKNSAKEEEFPIDAVFNVILDLVKVQFESHGIEISFKYDKILKLYGDKNMLEQVLINLLINAKDAYMEAGESENRFIEIKVTDTPTIEISDGAGGVSSDVAQKIFTPYFTTKEQGKGTGLGLYLSKRIMREHFNGDLFYEEIPNGSKFILDFRSRGGE